MEQVERIDSLIKAVMLTAIARLNNLEKNAYTYRFCSNQYVRILRKEVCWTDQLLEYYKSGKLIYLD